jgi:DNA-binding FadR family transcriptional regulator
VALSSQLAVSRGIIREAYRSLRSAGVIEIANGRSPRVGELNNGSLIQFLEHVLSTAQASPSQVFDIRSAVEVRAAELSAEKRSDEDAEALSAEAAAMRTHLGRRDRFVAADMRFHEIIGRSTANPLFELLGNALRESLGMTIRAGFDSRHSRAELARVAAIHAGIAEAIQAHDARRAHDMMVLHFDEARAFVLGEGRAALPRRGRIRRVAL